MEIETIRPTAKIPNQSSAIYYLPFTTYQPSWAVFVGVLVMSLSLALLPFVERTWRATGDEPHYLLTAHSLVNDLDFDLANNYHQLDYLAFYYSQDIVPQVRLSPTGQQILDHHLALPVLIAPAYALAGRLGVLAFQVFLGGLLAILTYKLALLVSGDEKGALWATLAVALTPPLFFYQYLVYPEFIATLLTTLVVYYAIKQDRPTSMAMILVLFSLVTLPWLNRRFIPLAILLALLIAWAWRRREDRGLKIVDRDQKTIFHLPSSIFHLPSAIFSIALLLWFNSQFHDPTTGDITAPATTLVLWERLARGIGWLVDQQRGLFIYAPVYLLALWGGPFLLSDSLRQRNRLWFVLWPFLLSLGVTAAAGGFWVAWELGPRFLVVGLPTLAPLLALAWRHYSHQKIWLVLALLLFGLSLSNSLAIVQNSELPYKSSLPLYYGQKLDLPLTDWLPDLAGYERISPTVSEATEAQVVTEKGEAMWLAEPGSSVSIVRSGPLPDLPFGHYRLTWLLRAQPGLPPDTELIRLSLKISGGGQVLHKIITAADLPADGSYGEVQLPFLNPNVDRWRTPLVLNAVSTGESRIWAKDIHFDPDPFYGWFLPYVSIVLLMMVTLLAWYHYQDQAVSRQSSQAWTNGWSVPPGVKWGVMLILPIAAFSWLVYQHVQSSRTYDVDELDHFVGQVIADPQAADGQGWLVDPQVDPPQKAIYGPFDIYDPGAYQVSFRIKLPESVETDQEIARLQVAATASFDELITQPLRLEHFAQSNLYHDFVLTLTNPRRQALSFEVYYLGIAPLLIDQVTITEVR